MDLSTILMGALVAIVVVTSLGAFIRNLRERNAKK
jgi:hypothetical protein